MSPSRWISVVVGVALGATALAGCSADDDGIESDRVTVFAASSLKVPFDRLATEFEATHPGTKVTIVAAASSTLAHQLLDGAAVDVFASASPAALHEVSEVGLLASTPQPFASNQAIAVRNSDSPITDFTQFSDGAYQISLCASAVPCGQVADELAAQVNLDTSSATREKDVLTVAEKVSSGDADAGVVYASSVQESDGRLVPLNATGTTTISSEYEIAILKSSYEVPAATDWVNLVTGPVGQRVLREAGFQTPG